MKYHKTNDQYGNNKSTAPKDAFELYTICCADQSQQSHIHIGADIQAALLEGPLSTRVVYGHQLEASDSVQEETSQVQAPSWNLSSSRRTAAPSPVCHTQICIVLSHLFLSFNPTTSFLNSLHYICGFSWGRVKTRQIMRHVSMLVQVWSPSHRYMHKKRVP